LSERPGRYTISVRTDNKVNSLCEKRNSCAEKYQALRTSFLAADDRIMSSSIGERLVFLKSNLIQSPW